MERFNDEDFSDASTLRTVVFRLADERFGIDADRVRRILPVSGLDVDECEAVMDDSAMPVLDLRRVGGSGGNGHQARVIVVESDGKTVGVLVDAVTECLTLDAEDVADASPGMFRGRACVRTMASGSRTFGLLDIDEALSA